MTDQKQLIKAMNDLTKALNKNTDAIKENTELSKLDMNTVESGTYNEPFLISPDQVSKIMNKRGVFVDDGIYSGSWGKGLNYEPENEIDLDGNCSEKIIRNIQANECSINSDGSFGLGFEVKDHEVLTTDGLGNSHAYKKCYGNIIQSDRFSVFKDSFAVSCSIVNNKMNTITSEKSK